MNFGTVHAGVAHDGGPGTVQSFNGFAPGPT